MMRSWVICGPSGSIGNFVEGTYLGLRVRRYFGKAKDLPPEFSTRWCRFHHYASEDRHGPARWYGYGRYVLSRKTIILTQLTWVLFMKWYIKQDGVWKILKLAFNALCLPALQRIKNFSLARWSWQYGLQQMGLARIFGNLIPIPVRLYLSHAFCPSCYRQTNFRGKI